MLQPPHRPRLRRAAAAATNLRRIRSVRTAPPRACSPGTRHHRCWPASPLAEYGTANPDARHRGWHGLRARTRGIGGSYGDYGSYARRPTIAAPTAASRRKRPPRPVACRAPAAGPAPALVVRARVGGCGTLVWANGEKRKAAAFVVLRRDALHVVLVAASRQGKQISSKSS
ncbi:unnamed protein product [Urochloa humidicola]